MEKVGGVLIGSVILPMAVAIWQRHYKERPKQWEAFLLALVIFVASAAAWLFLMTFVGDMEGIVLLLLMAVWVVLGWTMLYAGVFVYSCAEELRGTQDERDG